MREKVSFLHSSRCKLLIFCICLLAYGMMVAVLFAANNRRITENVQGITSLREEYYSGYASIARTQSNLKNYVGYKNEDYLQMYRESGDELAQFVSLLNDAQIGPQSVNLGRLC